MAKAATNGIVYTQAAKCADCNRCLRECPVKAIGLRDGQAYVDKDRCIVCGTCIRVCPQGAKTYRKDIEKVTELLKDGGKVAASVAPSFAAFFSRWQSNRLPSLLRKIGFSYVANASEGAFLVAKHFKNNKGTIISSACPAVVNYIEKFIPEFLEILSPIVSPMIAHGKMLKSILGEDTKVVFIGPCISKKYEAAREEYSSIIEAVLTFDELNEFMAKEGALLSECEESGFDSIISFESAGLFPLPGGFIKAASIEKESISQNIISTTGSKNIISLCDISKEKLGIVEPLFCNEGCINGPGACIEKNLFIKRRDLIEYYSNNKLIKRQAEIPEIDLSTTFNKDVYISDEIVPEAAIQKILEITGKEEQIHQLNCGACGYTSCRENAIAVSRGMAEAQMCIPYMRRQAEQRMDMIMETIPNGVVILDESLNIIGMNPAFRNLFLCSNATLGKRISYIFDSKGFEKLASGTQRKLEGVVSFNNIEYHQYIYSLKEQKQYVGIYTSIQNIEFDQKKVDKLKSNVLEKVVELRDQQIKMANQLAMLLGENTGRVEEILWRLMNIYDEE